jgi:hypothetical protein
MATATLTAPERGSASAEQQADARVYRCACGSTLRVFGLGRHRVYFQRDETAAEDAVLNRGCPACQLVLSGNTAA